MASCRPLLFLLAIQTVLAAAEPVHLPILRRAAPASVDEEYYARSADRLRARYAPADVSTSKRATGDSNGAEVPLVNQALDTEYLASISIGTPPQNLTVLLDTASADLWVVSNQCSTCAASKFGYTQSSTFQFANGSQLPLVTLTYPAGSVQGSAAQDSVSMGGLAIDSQSFVVTNQTISGILGNNASGIMGLAFSPVSMTNSTPFWQNLFNSNKLSQPLMSFWLTRYVNVTGAHQYEYGGELTLGGTNTTLYMGDIEYQNLANNPPDYWALQLTGVTLAGNALSVATPALAIFDIGAKYIAGPSTDVKNLWQAVSGSQPLNGGLDGYYSFPCNTSVQISFSFGGSAWAVDPADMNLGPLGGGQCLGAILELRTRIGNANWVMGETFMKNVYSVFRVTPPSLGFAHLSVLNAHPPTSTPSHPHSHSGLSMGALIGGIVGGVVILALVVVGSLIFLNRRKRVAYSEQRHEKLTADSPTFSYPSIPQSIYELTPFVPPAPLPHPRDSWSQRSSQPTFTAPWTAPGQMTPDTLPTDRADDYGLPSPIGMAFSTSAEAATSMPLLPRPVVVAPAARSAEVTSSGETSPVSPPLPPDHLSVPQQRSSIDPQEMERIMASLSERFQPRSPPMSMNFEDLPIYLEYERLMGESPGGGGTPAAEYPPAESGGQSYRQSRHEQ